MIVYGNTISVTAEDDATLGTVGEQIRGITSDNSEVAAIWEPNDKEHTQYVVNNNGRGLKATKQVVKTYGIKSAVASTADKTVTNINSNIDANLVAVNTFKPAYTTVRVGTDNRTVITNTEGNNIGLKPNQISKVRIYIWLEGQDPDCIDMASTGDKLNVNLKLTKDTNTTTNNTYEGVYTGAAGTGTYVTADTLPVADYGKYVTNYVPTNGVNDEGIKWKIFYADTEDDNIYLIADTYVPRTNTAGTKNYVPTGYNNTRGRYAFDFHGADSYNGTKDIVTNITSKWLKKYTDAGYTATSEQLNGKATAYLLDINKWAGFKDSTYAEYAVGGPTIELFTASYNMTHLTRTIETQVNSTGYSITWSDGTIGIQGELDPNESLYVISNSFDGTIDDMWLASPSSVGYGHVMSVYRGGRVVYEGYGTDYTGSRPIICLKDTVKLEKQADGNYKLVQ